MSKAKAAAPAHKPEPIKPHVQEIPPASATPTGTKRIFWTENASLPVRFQNGELQFVKCLPLAGMYRGYLITSEPSEILAIEHHVSQNRACREISARELEEKVGFTVEGALYNDTVPTTKTAIKSATPDVKSFLEQTPWDAGLFTFPTRVDLTVWYNCSIAEKEGQRFLFTRRHRYSAPPPSAAPNQSDLEIFRIRDNMSVTPAFLPVMPNRFIQEQFEDPRAVLGGDGSMYVSFASWVHHRKWFIRQSFCRLSQDWSKCEVVYEPDYGGNASEPTRATKHEKNWVWFEHAKQWHYVYMINPHVVVRHGQQAKVYHGPTHILPWEHGEPRGGTPPVRIGNEFLCFFHSALTWIPPKRRYYMGAYTFSAVPPFEIKRITPEPILAGSHEDFRTLGGPLVIFPNGALLEKNNDWLVVFGVNDENCGWIKIPNADLQKKLVSVKGAAK